MSSHFLQRQSQILLKNILRILQVILLRSFLTLLENLEYFQCVSITRKLTSVKKKLKFEKVSSVSILKILKEFKTYKATGTDNLAGRFLKEGSNMLCVPIAKICNLSIKLASFPDKCKVAKIKPFLKKVSKLIQRTSGPSCCFDLSLRLLSKLFMIKLTFYVLNINQVLKISIIRHLFVTPP